MTQPLTIVGNEGSPYSRKMRAVLRYRRIPHRWVVSQGPEYRKTPPVPVQVIPVLVWHNEDGGMREAMVDSTPQILRLEREYTGRSLLPPDPALALLAALIEDYGDEWCTKFMFHYRWADQAGIAWARRHLMLQIDPGIGAAQLEQFASWFSERQIGRRAVVGSSEETRATLEGGYLSLLQKLDALIAQRRFLFGDRPSAADFGLYGQLSQLCGFDPSFRADRTRTCAACRRLGRAPGGSRRLARRRRAMAGTRRCATGAATAAGRDRGQLRAVPAGQRRGAGGGAGAGRVPDRRYSLAPEDLSLSGQVPAMAARAARRTGPG